MATDRPRVCTVARETLVEAPKAVLGPRGATALVSDGMHLLWVWIPASWLAGLGLLWCISRLVGESHAFSCSFLAAGFAAYLIWRHVIARLDPSQSLWPIVALFVAKAILGYVLWSTFVLAPGENGALGIYGQVVGTEDLYPPIESLTLSVRYWKANGFTFPIPDSFYLPNNHRLPPQLQAIPMYLSANHPEVIIPWNGFFACVVAAAVLGAARIEGLAPTLARRAFLFALLMPFSWITANALKEPLLQGVLGLALLGMLCTAQRPLMFCALSGAAAWLLYEFRLPYVFITMWVAAYVFSLRRDRRISTVRALIGLGLLATLMLGDFGDKYVSATISQYQVESDAVMPMGWNTGALSPVKRLIVGLLVPFPWLQLFERPIHSWNHIPMYVEVVAGVALVGVCVGGILDDLRLKRLPPGSAVFALAFAVCGLSGKAIQPEYIQVSMVFLLPYAYAKRPVGLQTPLLASLLAILVGNVVWIAMTRT